MWYNSCCSFVQIWLVSWCDAMRIYTHLRALNKLWHSSDWIGMDAFGNWWDWEANGKFVIRGEWKKNNDGEKRQQQQKSGVFFVGRPQNETAYREAGTHGNHMLDGKLVYISQDALFWCARHSFYTSIRWLNVRSVRSIRSGAVDHRVEFSFFSIKQIQ